MALKVSIKALEYQFWVLLSIELAILVVMTQLKDLLSQMIQIF